MPLEAAKVIVISVHESSSPLKQSQSGTTCVVDVLLTVFPGARSGCRRTDIVKCFGVFEAVLRSQSVVIAHQKVLHIIEIGGIIIVAKQRKFLALAGQGPLETQSGIPGGALVLVSHVRPHLHIDIGTDVDDPVYRVMASRGPADIVFLAYATGLQPGLEVFRIVPLLARHPTGALNGVAHDAMIRIFFVLVIRVIGEDGVYLEQAEQKDQPGPDLDRRILIPRDGSGNRAKTPSCSPALSLLHRCRPGSEGPHALRSSSVRDLLPARSRHWSSG